MPEIQRYVLETAWSKYRKGDMAGLDTAIGEKLCKIQVEVERRLSNGKVIRGPQVIARRATEEDIRKAMQPKPAVKRKKELVPIVFSAHVGRYRAGDIAGFSPATSKRYVEGYMLNDGSMAGSLAAYYVAPEVTAKLEESEPEPEAEKPRAKPVRKLKRRKAAFPEAPEQK